MEKRNVSYFCWESNHDSLVFQPIAYSLHLLSYFIFRENESKKKRNKEDREGPEEET